MPIFESTFLSPACRPSSARRIASSEEIRSPPTMMSSISAIDSSIRYGLTAVVP